jgi:hypothetical protein
MNMKLIETGTWSAKAPVVSFPSAIAYFKFDKYEEGDDIVYLDDVGTELEGFAWHEMYDNRSPLADEMVNRDALSVLAAFISHCDNFDGNQGFICLDDAPEKNTPPEFHSRELKSSCEGTPFLFIHDVGGTLGYGWNLRHKNFWPNYFDLTQVCRQTLSID